MKRTLYLTALVALSAVAYTQAVMVPEPITFDNLHKEMQEMGLTGTEEYAAVEYACEQMKNGNRDIDEKDMERIGKAIERYAKAKHPNLFANKAK